MVIYQAEASHENPLIARCNFNKLIWARVNFIYDDHEEYTNTQTKINMKASHLCYLWYFLYLLINV